MVIKLIILDKAQYEEMVEHARTGLPNEACGLLGGTVEGDRRVVGKIYLLSNLDRSPEHFSMDPREQFAAVKDMRSKGWVLLGNFHSHPESPSRPSEEDKRLAFDPEASYLILSLQEKENPVLKSFNIKAGVVSEEAIEMIERV